MVSLVFIHILLITVRGITFFLFGGSKTVYETVDGLRRTLLTRGKPFKGLLLMRLEDINNVIQSFSTAS